MNAVQNPVETSQSALSFLQKSAKLWFIVAVIGQWIFAYYVAVTFGPPTLRGDLASWNESLPHGYVQGDALGNLAVGIHLALAFVILIGGPLQFIPKLQNSFQSFHRWNGRIYAMVGIITSISGIFMVWTRGVVGDFTAHLTITVNAILIISCALFTWQYAVKRQLDRHRRWALRLFMVMNGVWFFRVGLMFWLLINGKPVGFDIDSFTGPFLTFLGISQYVLPLLLLEWYFKAQKNGAATSRYALATTLFIFTIAISIGIFGASVGMWFPGD